MSTEQSRLEEARSKKAPWKMWGPCLSERQWGTVREDGRALSTRGLYLDMPPWSYHVSDVQRA
jgi:hypothetical protein